MKRLSFSLSESGLLCIDCVTVDQVLATDPVNFDSLISLGKIKYLTGDLERARDLFDRALVVRPEREKTMYHLGRVLYDMRVYERARLLFEQVCEC